MTEQPDSPTDDRADDDLPDKPPPPPVEDVDDDDLEGEEVREDEYLRPDQAAEDPTIDDAEGDDGDDAGAPA